MHYDRQNPFIAQIKERYCLTKPGSAKETQHIVLDISNSGISYDVGDSIGVQPINPPSTVQKTITAMKGDPEETISEKRTGETVKLLEFLSKKANLSLISKKLFSVVAERQTNPIKKTMLLKLLGEKDPLKKYLEEREVWDFLSENQEVDFKAEELCEYLMPLLPRLYSIASSQKVVGDEVHLMVAPLKYTSNSHQRLGVCTHYLCDLMPLGERSIPVYIQPHKGFTLPQDPQIPMIMIGPGTGIAPYRGFMQERALQETFGKNWLFFGEWNRKTDFFYEEEWMHYQSLRIDAAFSRDQTHKIYVQDRMMEKGEELFSWLQDGAYLYVCGDAERMAKDVDAALHRIVERCGRMGEDASKNYIKALRKEKRYLRDVY